jgi:hypothetical protein
MRKYRKKVVMALLLFAVLSIGAISGALAQELAKQIQGSWALVSNINEQDGKKTEVFGPNPRGFVVFTPEGRFSMIMMRASLPKFASNNRIKGSPEENQAVIQGSVAYFGSYKVVSEKDQKVNLLIDGCTFPNWDGQDLPRIITVSGDEMKLVNPAAAIGGTNYVILKRVK